jgi:diguanylate cyclase (GGDEF)-like protein/PAS domain S-box-containing protein
MNHRVTDETARFRILVIEDDDQDYRLLLRHLQRHGVDFVADRVARAQQLTDILDGPHRHWNLVLADHSLPDINIRAKLHWLIAKLPDAPVIMVSGSIGEETAVDLLLAGVNDFVSKDNLARLIPAMERTLDELFVRKAKQAAESELQLRNRALEAASNGIVITLADGDMPMVYVNPACERITGYPADELLGKNCRFLQADDQDQSDLEQIRVGVQNRQACHAVLRNYRRDGEMFWNRLSIAPVTDATGRTTHFVGVQEDISDAMRQQQRLRQSATVFENALEGMTVTDLEGTILEVNRGFTRITGYTREEALGQNPRLLQSGRHDRAFYQAMWTTLIESGRWHGEIWNRRRSGEIYPQLLTISVVTDEHDQASGYIGVFADISQIKESEQKLDFLAHHDPLTRLPNRLLFNARLQHAIQHARRGGYPLAVLFIDIDHFKVINDAHGHVFGDEVLREVGGRLAANVRAEDTVARIGGDEFIVLLERLTSAEHAGVVVEKIRRAFVEPVSVAGCEQYLTLSLGVSIYPRDAEEPEKLIRNADTAMYKAKDEGRDSCRFYTSRYTELAQERSEIDNALHGALDRDELFLHYQPQLDMQRGTVTGVEVLVRWQHRERGMIPPGVFIPIAEESGQIRRIGRWVLATACQQAKDWLDRQIEFGRLAVNIAGPQLRAGDLHRVVEDLLGTTGLPPDRLELEVTESFVMGRSERRFSDLERLKHLGVHLAIDDFGTGYSSLSYLKRLPIDRLKIDQSFVRDLPADQEDAAIADAIVALGHSLGLEVIAEGVETDAQRRFLLDHGCSLGQGYLFGKPMSAHDLADWMQAQTAV